MPTDPLNRTNANVIAAESGYSAPYLYLLDDDRISPYLLQPSAYTKRKLNTVVRAVLTGCGQGRGDAFKPWIRIRRNFSSPTSHQVFDSVGIQARNHHFLSKLEFHTALQISYLGALELRECLPLWPFEHPHPDSGLDVDVDAQLGPVPGLIEIAKSAGIDHGYFVGTTVPYVGSIDLMCRCRIRKRWKLVGISCKPKEIAEQSNRAQERIQLDRLYCQSAGALHMHEDGSTFNAELLKQLLWMRPLVSDLRAHKKTARLNDFTAQFEEYASDRCVLEATIAAGKRTGLNRNDSHIFFRLGVWLHLIDIDLTQRVQMHSKVKRGSAQVIKALESRYLGVSHD
ncbi:MAG: hypothetical protein Q7T07_00115 [Burkholderiaceae bacterium]|nr:hypothetical protein [Burkholderiaceae bacterium]